MDTYLSQFIGKVILFRCTKQFVDDALSLLQPQDIASLLYAKLIAIDAIGCWIENPSWRTIDSKTKEESCYLAHTLIPWHALVSASVFPERFFDGIPDEDGGKSIGFHANF